MEAFEIPGVLFEEFGLVDVEELKDGRLAMDSSGRLFLRLWEGEESAALGIFKNLKEARKAKDRKALFILRGGPRSTGGPITKLGMELVDDVWVTQTTIRGPISYAIQVTLLISNILMSASDLHGELSHLEYRALQDLV